MVQFPLAILSPDSVYCSRGYQKVAEADYNYDGMTDELYEFKPSVKDQKNCEMPDAYQL